MSTLNCNPQPQCACVDCCSEDTKTDNETRASSNGLRLGTKPSTGTRPGDQGAIKKQEYECDMQLHGTCLTDENEKTSIDTAHAFGHIVAAILVQNMSQASEFEHSVKEAVLVDG